MRLMPAKYAAALFDLDNTLWDRSAAILATGRLLHKTEPAVRATASAADAADKLAAAPALLALSPTSMGTPPYSYVSLVVANFQFNSRIVTSHRCTPWPQTIRIPATDRSR